MLRCYVSMGHFCGPQWCVKPSLVSQRPVNRAGGGAALTVCRHAAGAHCWSCWCLSQAYGDAAWATSRCRPPCESQVRGAGDAHAVHLDGSRAACGRRRLCHAQGWPGMIGGCGRFAVVVPVCHVHPCVHCGCARGCWGAGPAVVGPRCIKHAEERRRSASKHALGNGPKRAGRSRVCQLGS
jgi:hypothetical protein